MTRHEKCKGMMWAFLVASVLVMIVSIFSCFRIAGYRSEPVTTPYQLSGESLWDIGVARGRFFFGIRAPLVYGEQGFYYIEKPRWRGTRLSDVVSIRPTYFDMTLSGTFCCKLWIPLFPVAVIFFVPGAFLYCRNRTHKLKSEDCRQCGYNLTGNTSGRCPECGEVVHSQHS